jgi:hypothetical protein
VLVGAAGRRPDLFNAGQRQGLARGAAAPGRAADDAERTAEGQRIEKLSKERVEFAQEEEEAAKDLLDAGVRGDRERAEKERQARDKGADNEARDKERQAEARGRELAGLAGRATDIDELAAQRAGELRMAGMSEEDIANRLAPQIAQRLRQTPGVGPEQAGDAGRMMAEAAAMEGTAQMLAQGQMGLQNQGGLIGAVGGLAQGAQGLMAGQQQQAMAISQLLRIAEAVNRNGQANRGGLIRRGR